MTPQTGAEVSYRRTSRPVQGAMVAPIVEGGDGTAVRLAGPSARIWHLLEYPTTLSDLCRRLCTEFEGSPAIITAQTTQFLDRLLAQDLITVSPRNATVDDQLRWRYLYQVKRSVLNLLYPEHEVRIDWLLQEDSRDEWRITQRRLRDVARLWPETMAEVINAKWDGSLAGDRRVRGHAHTQVGLLRLDNIERCAEQVFADHIDGDFLEAGICQGGAAIFMRALQVAYGQHVRRVWLADSFQGVPPPTAAPDVMAGLDLSEARQPWLASERGVVEEHFRRYDLLDTQVKFLAGFFADSLPNAPIGPLAILRIDADLYSSTREVLVHLYDRVVPGGFVIVDDYGALAPCRQAVDEFRAERRVNAPLLRIDWTGVFWRKAE